MRLTKSMLSWSSRIVVAAAILFLVFRFIPLSDVIEVITLADGSWVTAAFIVLVIERFTAAWRMKVLTDRLSMPLSVLKIWEINTVSTFYTIFLPGDLAGGAVRWYRMSRPEGQRAQAFAAIVMERLFDTIVLVLIGLLFWFWDEPPFGTRLLDIVLIVFLFALVLVMALSFSPRTSTVLHRLIGLIPWQDRRRTISEMTEKVLVSVRTFRQLSFRALMTLFALTVLRHMLSILVIVCFAQSLAMVIGFSTIAWIRSLMNTVTMLPISFAGLGVREASFAVLMEPYGVVGSQAVALSLFLFIVYIVLALVGGLLELRNAFLPRQEDEADANFKASENFTN